LRPGACLIKYELIKQARYYDEELEVGVDMMLFLELAVLVDYISYVPKPLKCYLHRSGSLTRTIPFGLYGVIIYKKLLQLKEFKPYKKYIKQQIASWSLEISYFYRKNNNKLKAIQPALEAVLLNFKKAEHWKNLLASVLLC
jgi:hypothetical protein